MNPNLTDLASAHANDETEVDEAVLAQRHSPHPQRGAQTAATEPASAGHIPAMASYAIRTVQQPANTRDCWELFVGDRAHIFGPANLYDCCRERARLISAGRHVRRVTLLGEVTRAARATDPMHDPLQSRTIHRTVPASELRATITRWHSLGRKITVIIPS